MARIDSKTFTDLFNTAKKSTEDSMSSPTLASITSKKVQESLKETLGDATKAAILLAQKAKLSFKYYEKNKECDATVEGKSVNSVVNGWVALSKI